MLANGRLPEAPECYLSPLPLPNPLPEGRGDCPLPAEVPEWSCGFRLTPDFPSTPNGPLSLQGEGWGEGALKPSTCATGKLRSRASSLLRRAAARPHKKARHKAGHVRSWDSSV
ncbi:hypothetical protein Pssp01_22060 [Pseudomonas sp. NBRC 100443]|nr:hypothetical protein Pssp01_22060 [Pseudomonas sp. NBRC 100443]